MNPRKRMNNKEALGSAMKPGWREKEMIPAAQQSRDIKQKPAMGVLGGR